MKRSRFIIVSYSKNKGGAAKASSNFYDIIREKINSDAVFLSKEKAIFKNKTINANKIIKCVDFFLMLFSRFLLIFQIVKLPTKYSLNLFSSLFVTCFLSKKGSSQDIINFHWVNNDTVSIERLGKYCRDYNIIITLHDEWLYSGASHYCLFGDENWKKEHFSFDPLRLIDWVNFLRKKRYSVYFKKAVITVPSQWMLQRVLASRILKDCEVYLLPNPIDTSKFIYSEFSDDFNEKLNHKVDRDKYFYICFGAVNGAKNQLKGFSLLIESLKIISRKKTTSRIPFLIIFGSETVPSEVSELGIEYYNFGVLKTATELAMVYSFSHITVVASLLESFGQVAAESLSCETPVVCFETSGLTDIVLHKNNGFLAKGFDSNELAAGILFFLEMDDVTRLEYARRGRHHVVSNFDCKVVAKLYMNLIDKVRFKNV